MDELKKIFTEFDKDKIEFCVLRNYENIKQEKDIDILIKKEDKRKVKKIMKRFKMRKGIDFGCYLSCKNKVWMDFRIGFLCYQGFCFGKAKEILKRKRKFSYFHVLGYEDELVHLILHSILDKKYFKEKYIKRIEELMKATDMEKTRRILGKELFFLIEKKDYGSALKLRKKMFMRIFSFYGFIGFLALRLARILR